MNALLNNLCNGVNLVAMVPLDQATEESRSETGVVELLSSTDYGAAA